MLANVVIVGFRNSEMSFVSLPLLTQDMSLPTVHPAFTDSEAKPWMILENALIALQSLHFIPILHIALLETPLPLTHTKSKLTASRLGDFLPDYLP